MRPVMVMWVQNLIVSINTKRQRGRSERSSSIQGVFIVKVGDDRDGAAPKYKCGVYDILYLSRTANNLNRHTKKLRKIGTEEFVEEKEDVSEHFTKIVMENRFANTENMLTAIEKNRKLTPGLIVGLLLGFVVIYLTGLFRVYG
ncbi:hypothetical protein PIB30_037312 [Stylosanthes scabra]|uniref:Uncharacterized protein n=1 Tax=Stylosanthes scabra TaxID=79078 RepID=A0ABU6YCN4_9FABA|nr:hypothetical protein [Stylosanthes scabra]